MRPCTNRLLWILSPHSLQGWGFDILLSSLSLFAFSALAKHEMAHLPAFCCHPRLLALYAILHTHTRLLIAMQDFRAILDDARPLLRMCAETSRQPIICIGAASRPMRMHLQAECAGMARHAGRMLRQQHALSASLCSW